MTFYSEIFDRFKNKIQDKDLVILEEEDQIEQLTLWLDSAIGYIELDGLKITNNLSDRNNSYQKFNTDLSNAEIEIISLYMVVAWYDIKINSLEHTLMYFGSKDEKWTNQKDHLKETKDTREMYRRKAKNYFLNYSSKNNSYLKGGKNAL